MRPWLFSRSVDLGVFGGSAIVALTAVAVGWRLGIGSDTPAWA